MKIEITNLCRTYGKKQALKDVNLEIGEGMFGLLGPNGAGKTTLMRIMATIIQKTSGTVKINGIDISQKKSIRSIIGYLPQDFSVYPHMSVFEAMDYFALLSGIKGPGARKALIFDLLEKVNLRSDCKVKVRALSGGMKRRLGIAQALLNNPAVLIVDEPTAGLDPEERIRFRNLLCDFSCDRIVLLSTHIVEDIEFTCEKLAVLKEGCIAYSGSVKELLDTAAGFIWRVASGRDEFESLRKSSNVISFVSEGDKVSARVLSREKPAAEAVTLEPSIEDAYIKLIKGGSSGVCQISGKGTEISF